MKPRRRFRFSVYPYFHFHSTRENTGADDKLSFPLTDATVANSLEENNRRRGDIGLARSPTRREVRDVGERRGESAASLSRS